MDMAIVFAEGKEDGKKHFYGLGTNNYEFYNGETSVHTKRFGTNAKAVYGACIYEMVDVDAEKVASYAVSYNSVHFVLKGDNKKPISIVPEKPDAIGLIHFYKKEDNSWAFVTEDEYEAKKSELPALCFASHHPIADFNAKTWPDLKAIEASLSFSDGAPSYVARYTIDGDDETVKEVQCEESEALAGGMPHDMDPLVFIRLSKPAANACEKLPSLKLTDFFRKAEGEENVSFNIQRSKLQDADLADIEIKNDAQKAFLSELYGITAAQDAQIMSELDKQAKKKEVSILDLKPASVDLAEFTWSKESAIAKKSERIIKMRSGLLIELVKAWYTVQKFVNLDEKNVEGSLGHIIFSTKSIVPPSILSKIVDEAVTEISSSG